MYVIFISTFSDYGFKLRSRHSLTCETDPNSDLDIHKIPSPCYPGTYYSYTKGFVLTF